MMRKISYLVLFLFPLSACKPASDFQGIEPLAYESAHPKQNKVETLYTSHTVYFNHDGKLSADAKETLRLYLSDISPTSAEQIIVSLPSKNDANAHYLLRLLRAEGFAKRDVRFVQNARIKPGSARIDIHHTQAILPDCPDWHKSSISNYSNTFHSNARCATVSNLGMMVANPRDLEYGSGRVSADTARNALTVEKYHSGGDIAVGTASTGASSGAVGATGSQ